VLLVGWILCVLTHCCSTSVADASHDDDDDDDDDDDRQVVNKRSWMNVCDDVFMMSCVT